MNKRSVFFVVTAFAAIITSFTITQPVKEYLSVPGPVNFNNTLFSLAWSSNPGTGYYKQEYLPAKEKSETYTKMFIIEALAGDLTPKEAAQSKISELEMRKKTDPVTNYQYITNPKTGEYILDFVISSGDIVEWNVYRYTQLTSPSKALVLFAYSRRAYGAASTAFLKDLKVKRQADINSMAMFKVPAVKIKAE